EDDVPRFERLFVAVDIRVFDLAVTKVLAPALQAGDLVGLEQLADAAGQLLDDPCLARLHRAEIELDLARPDAVGGELLLCPVQQFRGLEQRLGRDAPGVEAGAAEGATAVMILPVVDAGRAQAMLGRAYGRRVPGGAATDHDHVVVVAHLFTWSARFVRVAGVPFKAGSAGVPGP